VSNLPSNWASIGLLDISTLVRGVTYTKADARDLAFEDSIPVLRANNIQDHAFDLRDLVHVPTLLVSSTQRVRKGDVVVATSSGSISVVGKAAQASSDMDAGFGAFCGLLRPNDAINAKYFGHYFSSNAYRTAVSTMARGVNINNLKRDHFDALILPIAPLPEQKRIADKLDAVLARVDACRDRLDRIPAILKRFRQSVLAAATSGKLTEDWRAIQVARMEPQAESGNIARDSAQSRYVVSAAPDSAALHPGYEGNGDAVLKRIQSKKRMWAQRNPDHNEVARVCKRLDTFSTDHHDAGDIPESWCWARLEDVALMVVDCHNKTAPYEGAGIALVRTSNVRDGRFVWDDLRCVSEDTYKYWSKRCPPEPGDIVFTREAPMGEAAIIPVGRKICLGQRTMLVRPVEDCYSARFLLLSMLDPKFKERSEGVAVGTGVKHYRVGDVSNLFVPVPPVEEQTEIVRRVEALLAIADRVEARYAAARAQVEKLTPATLAKAFRGELVPQDPNDEPASALLERIRAQRGDRPRA